MKIEVQLEKTCMSMPEQYDAYINGNKAGYLRLRHGIFTVNYIDEEGEEILMIKPQGDGDFTDKERPYYLRIAKEAIIREYKKHEHS